MTDTRSDNQTQEATTGWPSQRVTCRPRRHVLRDCPQQISEYCPDPPGGLGQDCPLYNWSMWLYLLSGCVTVQLHGSEHIIKKLVCVGVGGWWCWAALDLLSAGTVIRWDSEGCGLAVRNLSTYLHWDGWGPTEPPDTLASRSPLQLLGDWNPY